MKTPVLIILMAVLDIILQFFFDFWVAGVVTFILSLLFSNSAGNAFFSGFWAVGLVWLMMSLVSHIPNGGILTDKVSRMFSLPFSWLLIVITVFIGALIGGISALAGYHTANLFKK
jgi:cell division protein FtsX